MNDLKKEATNKGIASSVYVQPHGPHVRNDVRDGDVQNERGA